MGKNFLRVNNLDVKGIISGTGSRNQATGPDGTSYIQSKEDQQVTFGSLTKDPTSTLTIISKTSDDKALDVYDHGDTSNSIVEVKGTANADGLISVNSTDGNASVRLSNSSSHGQVETLNPAGDTVESLMGSDAQGGVVKTNDTDGNRSFEAGSDAGKRGFSKLYNADGDEERISLSVDSNDMGDIAVKDSSAVTKISFKLDSSSNAKIDLKDSGGTSKLSVDTNSSTALPYVAYNIW